MNQVYRVVWNATLGVFQVVSELARARSGKSGRSDQRKSGHHALNALAAAMLATGSPSAMAQFAFSSGTNPTDYTVDGAGNATVTGSIISALSWAVSASGTAGTLTNGGIISGALFDFENSGSVGALSNSGTIGGTIGGAFGIDNARNLSSGTASSIGTISNSGMISASSVGIINTGTISLIQNQSGGVISAWNNSQATGIINTSIIGTLSNSGTIAGKLFGISNGINTAATSTISSLQNQQGGLINGSGVGIANVGTIGTLSNSGTISGGSYYGIGNRGSIGTLSNSGTIFSNANWGIINSPGSGGTISLLQNLSGGVISANGVSNTTSSADILNNASIGTLSNSGTIAGTGYRGIWNFYSYGTIAVLSNQSGGTISGAQTGIYNGGYIGALVNSGTISGPAYALLNQGPIGVLANTGLIKGNVANASVSDLNIQGGTGSVFGTFTGYAPAGATAIGLITSTSSNVNLIGGNILLNDNVSVGSFALNNTGTGVLQINNPITISGNYNQGANAALQISNGRLVVSGAATVASGSSITLASTGASYGFAPGQRYLVIQGGAGSSYGGVATQGGVGTLNYSISGYTPSAVGNAVADGSGLDLVLTLNGTPSNPSATAPNAIAALGSLNRYTGLDPQMMALQNAAAYADNGGASADQINRLGKQLGPFGGASGAASSATMAALDVVGSRMGGAGSGGYASMDGGGLGTGIATGEATRDWIAWGQAFGGHANQSQRDQVDGYSASYGGILLGIDKDLRNNWRAGGAFSYSNTDVNSSGDTRGNSANVSSYGLIGYARYQGSPWYVNLSATAARQQYSTFRNLDNIPGFSGIAAGRSNGMQYAARAEAGYPVAFKNDWVFTPLGSLTYSYQNQGSYTESGGSGAALSVGATHASSLKSGLGARLEKSYSTRYGQVVPFVQAQWIHEYDTSRQAVTAGFSVDPSTTAFTTYGASPIANMADVALGVTLIKADNLSISARYEVQAARGFFAQTGFVKLQMRF